MPRRSKGPRLYLRKSRSDRIGSSDVWVIRDGSTEISTGCGAESLHGPDGAESKLADYIALKWTPAPTVRSGDPEAILVADVLAFYAQRKAPKLADPVSAAIRVRTLLTWWGDKTLADVKLSTCEDYVTLRTTQPLKQAKYGAALDKRVSIACARRELEDLSAAIGFWAKENPLVRRPIVSLPPKNESPRDALTRSQAAALLLAAMGWRWEPFPTGKPNHAGIKGRWKRLSLSARLNRAHLRRFVLIGLYTGTRPGVIPKVLWEESPTQAWTDLDSGTIYRRGKRETEHRTKRRPLVKMPDRLLAHMRRWRAADLVALAERRAADEAKGREGASDQLSTVLHHGGRPIAGRIRRGFAALVRDAALDPDITPHWMRHTCCTWLMEGGTDLWEAAKYTGMTTKTLEDHYGHHRPDHQEGARRALGRPR
ncbi:tyrosine-type recombinase/integrase [Caulobacter sp. NIBR2454]|uniref:tyrosine-type recombinase/integrase n=1 Tax=Caulobacter sp. NIBR2454 TaxID=3015996 RepID=UPI0022B62E63|nr:tyrosine-type recombinase/integrase [Caulobacter sp. NIBR2454]